MKAEHGDCNVPLRWAEDRRLGRWVNTQRVLKRKLDRGEPSEGMTVARVARLTALGLVWDLVFTKKLWNNDHEPTTCRKSWAELTAAEQARAAAIGETAASWDAD
jgi:hypothetical protein